MNPTGDRLKQMTGVAAVLKYPVVGLDDVEEEEDSSTDSDSDSKSNHSQYKDDSDISSQ